MNTAHKSVPPLTLSQVTILVAALWGLGFLPYLVLADKAGQFGDTFGAINALFSGLAFAGVVYAIFLQRQDLALQREELAKASGAGIRQMHIALQQMAINDPELQEVWEYGDDRTPKERKQRAYVNLILSNWETLFSNGTLSSQQLTTTSTRYMKGAAFQAFWLSARDYRKKMAQGGTDAARQFHTILDRAYEGDEHTMTPNQ